MPIVNKTKRTAAIFNHGREVVKVYDHGVLAWQKSIPDYLCFTALEAGQFTLTIPAVLSTNANSRLSYIEWSKDGRSWNRTENKNSTEITIPVDVVTGDKVYWRGSGTSMTSASVALTSDCRFMSTARFNASGHLLSLLKLDDYDATTGWSSATFANLFYQATTLIDASGIILPALVAGNAYTFYGTFYECTNLVAAPDFNTSYTGNYMCFQMYRGCTSLTTMPKLPTTLSTSIFSGMFRGCTSLAITQPLNYSTLAENCFANMFNGCSSLSYVKCLATDISANGCLTNWLNGVSSTGTFIQAEGVEWPRGASGIPTGWADVEKRTMPQGYKQVEYLLNPNLGAFNLQHVFDSANETIELQFVNTADGGMFLGTTNHGGYYGNISVGKSGTTNLSVKIGIGDTTVNTSIIGMTANAPMTFRYEGNANGFKFYTNGTLQKSYTGGWDVQHTITVMYVYSNTESTTAPSTYPTWFGKCPFIGLKVWDGNSDIIIDFVPCIRESDGLAGFYDFARTTFYYSLNGNDFTAGEEI